MSLMHSATDGLPWPVVALLAIATWAALYGVALLAERWHRPPPAAAPTAVPATVVPVSGYEDEEEYPQ